MVLDHITIILQSKSPRYLLVMRNVTCQVLLHDSHKADSAQTSFCLCLNPGMAEAPWLADLGLLIGEEVVSVSFEGY